MLTKKSPLILILSFIICANLFAQNFDNYKLLKGTGTVPEEFLTPSSVKYEKELASISKSEKRKIRKDKEKFFLESNFLIDDLLQSGKVLFNDPVTEYINKVADELLKDNPSLRKSIRFYAVRSSAVNAFATNQGIIFVNIGLLAQLETEAQLAFVLAHEISHVRHKHALNMYLESKEIDRKMSSSKLFKQASFDNKLIAKNYFSKELETEADQKGIELYMASKYKLSDISGVFDVLQYSYLPFELTSFDYAFLETKSIRIPAKFRLPLEEQNEIGSLVDSEDDNDTYSTHPSVNKRRTLAAALIASSKLDSVALKSRRSYVVDSQKKFETIRDIARFELCHYYLHQMNFQRAIYAAFLLSKKYPKSNYLSEILTKSLYGYSKVRTDQSGIKAEKKPKEEEDVSKSNLYQQQEGPIQSVFYALEKMKYTEVNVLAIRHAWQFLLMNPKNIEAEIILKELFAELAYYKKSRSSFSKIPAKDSIAPNDFSKYAFADILYSDKFKKYFNDGQEAERLRRKKIAYAKTKKGKKEALVATYYKTLGIDSIISLAPVYINIKMTKKDAFVRHLSSEKYQEYLSSIIEENATRAGIAMSTLDPASITSTQSHDFNDWVFLSEWVGFHFNVGNNISMNGMYQSKIKDIMTKYGRKYILLTLVGKIQGHRNFWLVHNIVFNMETGQISVLKEEKFATRGTKTLLKAHIYEALLMAKTPKYVVQTKYTRAKAKRERKRARSKQKRERKQAQNTKKREREKAARLRKMERKK